jgi:hypothetical protein
MATAEGACAVNRTGSAARSIQVLRAKNKNDKMINLRLIYFFEIYLL